MELMRNLRRRMVTSQNSPQQCDRPIVNKNSYPSRFFPPPVGRPTAPTFAMIGEPRLFAPA
jgi:hypothetical protein